MSFYYYCQPTQADLQIIQIQGLGGQFLMCFMSTLEFSFIWNMKITWIETSMGI